MAKAGVRRPERERERAWHGILFEETNPPGLKPSSPGGGEPNPTSVDGFERKVGFNENTAMRHRRSG